MMANGKKDDFSFFQKFKLNDRASCMEICAGEKRGTILRQVSP
jgi:hypothetical protein